MATKVRDIPASLYHATSVGNWRKIQKQGLLPFMPAVYMTDDFAAAKYFAQQRRHEVVWVNSEPTAMRNVKTVVLAIDTSGLDTELLGTYHEPLCDILGTTDFWHYYGIIAPQFITELSKISNKR